MYDGVDLEIKKNIQDIPSQIILLRIIKEEIGKYFNNKWDMSELKNPQDYFNKIDIFEQFRTMPISGRIVNIIN